MRLKLWWPLTLAASLLFLATSLTGWWPLAVPAFAAFAVSTWTRIRLRRAAKTLRAVIVQRRT